MNDRYLPWKSLEGITLLAVAAGRGDAVALREFVRQTQVEVWRLCAHLGGRDRADDLAQEVYLRALPALAAFRAESSARTWLLSITRRTVSDAFRSERRRRAGEAVVADATLARREEVPADRSDLYTLVAGLAEDRRVAFVLTQVLGLSYAEAAEVCDCPVGTIRSRVARARADLLGCLDESAAR